MRSARELFKVRHDGVVPSITEAEWQRVATAWLAADKEV